jgi:hypothetical protein
LHGRLLVPDIAGRAGRASVQHFQQMPNESRTCQARRHMPEMSWCPPPAASWATLSAWLQVQTPGVGLSYGTCMQAAA